MSSVSLSSHWRLTRKSRKWFVSLRVGIGQKDAFRKWVKFKVKIEKNITKKPIFAHMGNI